MSGTDSKPWFASKTIWAGVMGTAASAIALVAQFRPDLISDELFEQVGDPNTPAALATVGTLIASLVAIVGRMTAKKPVRASMTGKAPALLLCGVLSLGVGGAVVVPGCALVRGLTQSDADLLKAYDQANEIYIALVQTAIDARLTIGDDGKPLISTDDWRDNYLPAIQRGDRLLDQLQAAAEVGNATELKRLLALLEAVNAELRSLN